MNLITKLDKWSDEHHSGWIDALRIVLGLILHAKGFLFIANTAKLQGLLLTYFGTDSVLLVQFIAGIHLLAGFLLIIGLATRVACALQIPVILGAIFFVNSHVSAVGITELLFSILVLFLLIFYLFEGSGRFSVSYYFKNSARSRMPVSAKEMEKPADEMNLADDAPELISTNK